MPLHQPHCFGVDLLQTANSPYWRGLFKVEELPFHSSLNDQFLSFHPHWIQHITNIVYDYLSEEYNGYYRYEIFLDLHKLEYMFRQKDGLDITEDQQYQLFNMFSQFAMRKHLSFSVQAEAMNKLSSS